MYLIVLNSGERTQDFALYPLSDNIHLPSRDNCKLYICGIYVFYTFSPNPGYLQDEMCASSPA